MKRLQASALCVFLVGGSGALLGGCKVKKQVEGQPLPTPDKKYAGDAAGLKALWTDILEAAQKDDRDRVHDLMASMVMTHDDLVALFGAERAAYLEPRYLPMIGRAVNVGALELVANVAERKYDDIAVIPVEAAQGAEQKATLDALKVQVPVYAVRVKKKSETLGLRYDFFVYRDGRWTTGNQIAKYLVPQH